MRKPSIGITPDLPLHFEGSIFIYIYIHIQVKNIFPVQFTKKAAILAKWFSVFSSVGWSARLVELQEGWSWWCKRWRDERVIIQEHTVFCSFDFQKAIKILIQTYCILVLALAGIPVQWIMNFKWLYLCTLTWCLTCIVWCKIRLCVIPKLRWQTEVLCLLLNDEKKPLDKVFFFWGVGGRAYKPVDIVSKCNVYWIQGHFLLFITDLRAWVVLSVTSNVNEDGQIFIFPSCIFFQPAYRRLSFRSLHVRGGWCLS